MAMPNVDVSIAERAAFLRFKSVSVMWARPIPAYSVFLQVLIVVSFLFFTLSFFCFLFLHLYS